MSKLKIGIIGAGYIGGVHAGILVRDDRVEIAAVHDVVVERMQALAQNYGARVTETAHQAIDICDAVYITTPNTKHTGAAIAAANAGKHVFCEKPMATNLADAKAVSDAAEKSGTVFQVGHNRRFAPVYATVKRMVQESHSPHSAHLKMNRGELLHPEWVGSPEVTGGFLHETTIHMFDMMRFLFGEIAMLEALGSSHEYPEPDDFSLLLRFANGVHATFASAADASWLFPFERVEIFGHHSTIETREMESVVYTTSHDGKPVEKSFQELSKEEKWGYSQEDKSFIDSILEGTAPAVTARDGYKSVELVNGCYQSVKTGQAVRL